MTFENNVIYDMNGMVNILKYLKNFERLESLNFRCNENFNDEAMAALAEGVSLKKELRVSKIEQIICLYFLISYRPLTLVKTKSQTKASISWVKHSKHMFVYTCFS